MDDHHSSALPDTTSNADFAGVARRTLQRVPVEGSTRELVLAEVTYQPGVEAPRHRHPVGGILYVVEGTCESAYEDEPPVVYRAGETLQDRPGAVHTLFRNADAATPLRFLTLYVIEPALSYASPA